MAKTSPTPTPAPYVRAAGRDELDALANLARRAFINDPAFNYGANLKQPLSNDVDNSKRRTLEAFHRMLFQMAFCLEACVMVVAVPEASSEKDTSQKTKERLAAACIWMPPGKRVGLQHPLFLLHSGVLRVIRGWGINFLMRLGFEYPGVAEKAWKSIWKEQKIKGSADHDTWYCQLVCVSPDDQGKGYLSLMMREMFQKMSEETLTLDASNPKARDQYAHLGFRLEKPFTIGKGKATAIGFRGKGGPGVELYGMAKADILLLEEPTHHLDAVVDKPTFRPLIWKNLLESAHAVVGALAKIGLEPLRPANKASLEKLASYELSTDPTCFFSPDIARAIQEIWKDPIIPTMMDHSSEFYLMDSASYFFAEADRVASSSYTPTKEDVLRARAKSTGITETRFNMGTLSIHMFAPECL